MISFFKYYYYRMFNYFSDGSSIPLFRAFAIMFVFAYFNLAALSTLIFSVGLNVRFNLPVEGFWPLIIIVPSFALFYYFLKRYDLHNLIFEKYSTETKRQKIVRGRLVIFYFICSILFFVLALWIRQVVRGY